MTPRSEPAGLAPAGPPLLSLSRVTKAFGDAIAVHPVDLSVEAGSFTAILGPSGCGKSTLLRMIGGFALPSSGTITIAGEDVTRLPPQKRPTNMVFQSHGLFPHMTVWENIAFGLSIAGRPRAEIGRRVGDAIALVRLDGFDDRPVDRLSGGQQQRVALARALVMRPKILLLDEPLSALDLKLRQTMQEELRRIHREAGGTFIYVTHDQNEAFALADRLVVMNAGRVEQVGRPHEVYRKPASLFAARFVGDANVLDGTRTNGRVKLDVGACLAFDGADGRASFVLRPEDIRLDAAVDCNGGERVALAVMVIETVHLGGSGRVSVSAANGQSLMLTVANPDATLDLAPGVETAISWPAKALVEISR
jgi:ABC-type Fe3+/spermidine/putrescine transport system ATPase subunit